MPASEAPLLSLVVATVDRVSELHRLLSSLLDANLRDVEVIVVDQNSDDRLRPVLDEMSSRMRLQWLRQSHRGASAARNAGAVRARGVWLGFPDDDCAFYPHTLPAIREAIASRQAELITGMTRDADGQPSVVRWHANSTRITSRLLRSTFAESTLYLRRDLFWSVNGFDEMFGPGSHYPAEEGIDLVRRLASNYPALRTMYAPDICFYHRQHLPYADGASVAKAQAYARARGALFARHWKGACYTRALHEVTKHLAGSLIFSGLRRRSRITTLTGLCYGFCDYLAHDKHNVGSAELKH